MNIQNLYKSALVFASAIALVGCLEGESVPKQSQLVPSDNEFDGGLIANGSFESEEGWSGIALDVVNGSNFANVASAGNPFDVNLSYVLPLQEGFSYTLGFDSRGTSGRSLIAGIGLNEAPWSNVTETLILTADWQTYTFKFKSINFGRENSRVLFDMGADIGEVYIDNVSLFNELILYSSIEAQLDESFEVPSWVAGVNGTVTDTNFSGDLTYSRVVAVTSAPTSNSNVAWTALDFTAPIFLGHDNSEFNAVQVKVKNVPSNVLELKFIFGGDDSVSETIVSSSSNVQQLEDGWLLVTIPFDEFSNFGLIENHTGLIIGPLTNDIDLINPDPFTFFFTDLKLVNIESNDD